MQNKFDTEIIASAYANAPLLVKNTFTNGDIITVVQNLQSTYGLHIDTSGVLSDEIGYLLIGLISPTEFYERLHAQGLPKDTVSSIVRDVNEKIFLPLQQKMRAETPTEKEEPLVPEVLTEHTTVNLVSLPTDTALINPTPTPSIAPLEGSVVPLNRISMDTNSSSLNTVERVVLNDTHPHVQRVPNYSTFDAIPQNPQASVALPTPPSNYQSQVVPSFTSPVASTPQIRTMASDMQQAQSGAHSSPLDSIHSLFSPAAPSHTETSSLPQSFNSLNQLRTQNQSSAPIGDPYRESI
jgi:hypothetical protein